MFLLPFAEPGPLAGAMTFHARDVEAIVGYRKKGHSVSPVFEYAAINSSQIVQEFGLIVGESRPQGVMMSPLDYSNCIDLYIAQMLDRLCHAVFPDERIRVAEKL